MSEAEDFAARMESIRMIRDSAEAVVQGDLQRIRALRFAAPGFDPAMLRGMGELGWIGLRLTEEQGGIGLGMAENCALHEELGAGLVPEPLVAAQLSAALLAASGEADLCTALLSGEALVATAWQEAADTIEAPGSDAARVFVPAGAQAFLVPRREAGRLALHLLPAEAQSLETQGLQDGGSVARFIPRFETGKRLATDIGATLDRALDEAALATAAMLLGVVERSLAMTLDYLRTRQQFGKPIGSFQALQHRAVDLRIQAALTRASVESAAVVLDAAPGLAASLPARRAATSRAKARAAEAAMRVTREAVQMHGAIGYTDEYDVGLFLRKAMVLANAFGSAALHRRRFLAHDTEDEGAA